MKFAKFVGNLARISCILEISARKPGNVSAFYDFEDVKYENFVYGGIFIGNAVEKAFIDGYKGKILIGKRIYDFVKEVKIFNNTNTHFGIALLFIPIGCGLGFLKKNKKKFYELRNFIDYVIKNTKISDAIYFYNASKIFKIGGIEKYKGKFDITNKNFKKEIVENNINFYYLMKISDDLIAKELTTKMEISFYALKKFKENLENYNIRDTIVKTYIMLLSEFKDTHIEKKFGTEVAEDVKNKAMEVIENFNEKSIRNFENFLIKNKINPGSIADITTNAIFLYFLEKWGH